MASGQILIVSADERWRRVLEVTVQLAGAGATTGASLAEALSVPIADATAPTAIVIEVSAQATTTELDEVREQLRSAPWPAVVILPERLVPERDRVSSPTTTILVRPYRPSELYAAIWPLDTPVVSPAATDAPLTLDPPDATDPASPA